MKSISVAKLGGEPWWESSWCSDSYQRSLMQSTFSRDRAEMLSMAGTRLLGACHIPGGNVIGHQKLRVQMLSSLVDFLVCEEKGLLP